MNARFQDYLEHTHVHVVNRFNKESDEYFGSQAISSLLVSELHDFKFTDVKSNVLSHTPEQVTAYVNAIKYKRLYITVHHVAQRFQLSKHESQINPLNFRPRLGIEDHVDNGRPAEFHIQILGGVNRGKTTLANMLKKVISQLSPTTDVVIVDTDPYTFNFYYGDDAQRESFLTNLRHQKINVGIQMLHGL